MLIWMQSWIIDYIVILIALLSQHDAVELLSPYNNRSGNAGGYYIVSSHSWDANKYTLIFIQGKIGENGQSLYLFIQMSPSASN